MKKSIKSILACLLAVLLVVPAMSGILADETAQVNGTLESLDTVPVDVSGIRNGRTLTAANAEVEETVEPDTIVSIMVELKKAPAADKFDEVKGATSYREELLADQKKVVANINKTLGLAIEPTHNYTVLFNGFAFEGEYRLIAELNEMDGITASMAMGWESPKLFNTTSQVHAIEAWDIGYSGEGTCVAIIDTGCKVTHPAFSNAPDNVKITADDIAMLVELGNLQGGSSMDPTNVYYSAKIPFRWNYVKNTYNVNHTNGTGDHGTHVSGIAAGNGGEIQGIAKDAQLAIMQVFNDNGGAGWPAILAALEDCVVLGVDSANLSLGSPCGREEYWNSSYEDVYERVVNAGINLAMAAGNDYSAAMCNAWSGSDPATNSWVAGGYNLVTNPDSGVVGSPSTWKHGVSVAAVQNSKASGLYVSIDGFGIGYTENEQNMAPLAETLGGQTLEFVMVPGYGEPSDYAGLDVDGKVALVSRGETNFVDKGYAAQEAGAAACIIYNNVSGEVLNMVPFGTLDASNNLIHDGNEGQIPHVAITREAAQSFMDAENKQVFISAEAGIYDAAGADMPTDFSSWGCTANLGMKPEITAPGGAIYSSTDSAISGTDYQAWDGTSMATPHIAGGMAIITQYVNEKFPNLSLREKEMMVNTILMSTATPVYDKGGDYALVRDQGAGEMNVEKAVTTTAYLTVEGCERPKLEIGDDPEKTGVYTLTFTVNNFGDSALQYVVRPSVLLNDLAVIGYADEAQNEPIIAYTETGYDLVKDQGMVTVDKPSVINVPAGGTAEVTVTIRLTAEAKEYIDTYYTSGSFIEGFIELVPNTGLIGDADQNGTMEMKDAVLIARKALNLVDFDANVDLDQNGDIEMKDAVLAARISLNLLAPVYGEGGEGVSLTMPYLGYYGDWNYAETIDIGYYYQDVQLNSNNYPNTAGYKKGSSIQPLGFNPFIDTEDLSYYMDDRNAISPNNDSVLDTFNLMYCGLVRNSYVRYVVLDTNGNELGVISDLDVCSKGFFDTSFRDQLGVNYGQFPGNYNFSQYGREDLIIRIEAKFDNQGNRTHSAFSPELSKNWKWDIPLHIDTTAPVVNNFSASGSTFNFNVTDEHYVAYVAVYTNNNGQLGNLVAEQGVFETSRNAVTSISMSGSTNNFVLVGDYAGNTSVYLWDGNSLTLQEGQSPTPQPVGEYENCAIFSYGLNLPEKQWVVFRTEAIADVYNGENTPSGEGFLAAGFDANTNTLYAAGQDNNLYRYSLTNQGLTGKALVGSLGNQYNEMAYDSANNVFVGIAGATDLYQIDPATGAETSVGSIQNGVVAMDFDENGILYFVDAYGMFFSVDLYGDGQLNEICELGISPVNTATGSFYNQSGCLFGHTFYWGSIDAVTQVKSLVRIDVRNGAFESMGVVLSDPGMQMTGMFAVDMQLNNIVPREFSNELTIAE